MKEWVDTVRLAWTLARADLRANAEGTLLGRFWPMIQPLLMLAVLVFVFGAILQFRWGQSEMSLTTFAIGLFVGLSLHAFFAEVITRAPVAVLERAALVKKVVFPVEALPLAVVIRACVPLVAAWVALSLAQLARGQFHAVWLLAPLVALPIVLLALGLAWLLAALGVYFRDLAQLMPPVATMLLFLAPVFYPLERADAALRPWLLLNPLTWPIEALRNLLLAGQLPDFAVWGPYVAGSLLFAWGTRRLFSLLAKGFGDVL